MLLKLCFEILNHGPVRRFEPENLEPDVDLDGDADEWQNDQNQVRLLCVGYVAGGISPGADVVADWSAT